MKNKLEVGTLKDLQNKLTPASAESKNRPAVAMSTFAGSMVHILPVLREAQASGLLGKGYDFVIRQLDMHKADFELLNTFGRTDILRTETSLHASVASAFKMLKVMNNTPHFDSFLMSTLKLSQALMHMSYQLAEWTAAAAHFPEYARSITRPHDQPAKEKLIEIQSITSKKRCREELEHYFATILHNRSRPASSTSAGVSAAVDFAALGAEQVDEEQDA